MTKPKREPTPDPILAALDARSEYVPKGVRKYPPDVARARHLERHRRSSLAQQRALAALARLHRDDYTKLNTEAKRRIDKERGPLPGDDT